MIGSVEIKKGEVAFSNKCNLFFYYACAVGVKLMGGKGVS